jgi:hypothetical protein
MISSIWCCVLVFLQYVRAGDRNLFAQHGYYVNERYQARVQASIDKAWVDDGTRAALQRMMDTGSAFWIDSIARVRDEHGGITLKTAFRDAASQATPPLVVAILYNLPKYAHCNTNTHIAYLSSGHQRLLFESLCTQS